MVLQHQIMSNCWCTLNRSNAKTGEESTKNLAKRIEIHGIFSYRNSVNSWELQTKSKPISTP